MGEGGPWGRAGQKNGRPGLRARVGRGKVSGGTFELARAGGSGVEEMPSTKLSEDCSGAWTCSGPPRVPSEPRGREGPG